MIADKSKEKNINTDSNKVLINESIKENKKNKENKNNFIPERAYRDKRRNTVSN